MKRKIVLILPNIRSLFNVGSFFRTADAFAVEKIYLTGITGTPDSLHGNKISKVALGAEQWIPREYRKTTVPILKELKKNGWQILALEQSKKSKPLTSIRSDLKSGRRSDLGNKVALVVGNEVKGLPKSILEICDLIVEIPMHGKKESLNVAVAGGIALYFLRNR